MSRWDAQISPSQCLISQLAKQPYLENLQLRLGSNSTPHPYFHPLLHFDQFPNLTTLSLLQINNAEVLRSIGRLINSTPCLSKIRIEADSDSQLSLAILFKDCKPLAKLHLTTIDIRGFTDLNCSVRRMWEVIEPKVLQELTLQIDSAFNEEDYNDFWLKGSQLDISLNVLSTNAIVGSFLQFLSSFSGLSTMILSSNTYFNPRTSLDELLHVLISKHSDCLEVLAIHPQGFHEQSYLFNDSSLTKIVDTWRGLSELSFGVSADDIVSPLTFSTQRDLRKKN